MAKKISDPQEVVAYNEPEDSAFEFDFCSLPQMPERQFESNVIPERAALINLLGKKWVNGTKFNYYFFDRESDGELVTFADGAQEWRTWTASEDQKNVVRDAFKLWMDVGIGVSFEEVNSREEAEIRIGFMQGDGSWSFVGRDILNIGLNERTMNFGWSLTRNAQEIDTAVHEIGHTLGFPHEHQNPNAGIVWNEEAVYTALSRPPNRWPREKTFHNIIRKIDADEVQGSSWDPHSIMHYPFPAGLILQPAEFRNGLAPDPGLSMRDKEWVKKFYPPLHEDDYEALRPLRIVRLDIEPGEQLNFVIKPTVSRNYTINTFGISDTVMVLFEDDGGELRYVAGDDDSGLSTNARIRTKLYRGRRYVLRIRLYYKELAGQTAVMMW